MGENKSITLVIPRGEVIRNFIYSGTADLLNERKDVELSIISVIPNKEIEILLQSKCKKLIDLKDVDEAYPVRLIREILDLIHGRYLWSEASKNRWMMRDFEANTISKKVKRFFKKLFTRVFVNRFGVSLFSFLEEQFSQNIFPSKKYVKIIREINPVLVFNGSHIHCKNAYPVMHAAKKLNVRTMTFLFSWDNLTSQGRIIPAYDFYLSWNKQIASHLQLIYPNIKSNQVAITGTPQFDFHFDPNILWSRNKFCEEVGADERLPIILYTTGMANHMPAEDIIIERLADLIATLDEKPQLLVRVYAKDLTGRFNRVKEARKDILFPSIPWEANFLTPMPKDIPLWTNMLHHCSLGINVASTVALELCMFDKPSLNVCYNPPGVDVSPVDYTKYYGWDHYKPIVDSGAVELGRNEEELLELIKIGLKNPELNSSNRKKLLNEFFGDSLDGKSHLRVADNIYNFAHKTA